MKNNSSHLLLLLVGWFLSSASSTAVTSDNSNNHGDQQQQQLTREEFRQLLAQHDGASMKNQRPHSRQLQEKYDSPELKDITAQLNSYIQENHGGDVDKAFNSFDVNDDGTLGRVEAIYVASKIGNYESNIDVSDKILDQYSTRNSMERSLDLQEFRAAAKGDPHFTTLMGRRFSYHGACDLNLIQHPGFNLRFQRKNNSTVASDLSAASTLQPLGMDLHVRTEHMLQQQYSFISNIALKIGSSVLEVTADGRDWVDGHSNRNFPLFFSEGQFPINKTVIGETCWGVGIEHQSKRCGPHILYDVILGGPTNDHIMIKVTKQMIHLDIKTSLETMKGSRGLLGTLKEDEVLQKQANSSYPLIEILGRDGTSIVRDFENYARHWQVVPSKDGPLLFQGAREPQFPNRCIEPVVLTPSEELRAQPQRRLRTDSRRRRNLETLREAAQKACYNVKPMEDVEFCIQDILATGDLSMAEAVYGA